LSTKITQLIQIIFVFIQKNIRILANKLFFRMKCLEFETKDAKKNQCTFGSFVDRLFKFLVLNTLCIWTTGTHFWYFFLNEYPATCLNDLRVGAWPQDPNYFFVDWFD
jgi:hypothetical protein